MLPVDGKEIEKFTDKEREQIRLWTGLIERWQQSRAAFDKKTDADKYFVNAVKLERGPMFPISEDTIYRAMSRLCGGWRKKFRKQR